MSRHRHLLTLALLWVSFLAAGCAQNEGASSPTAPVALTGGGDAQGRFGCASPAVSTDGVRLTVTKNLGPNGGVIEAGPIAARFPAGSLPPGSFSITLIVWQEGDACYFTLEPRDLKIIKPVEFGYRLQATVPENLTFSWNDHGWRQEMTSWLDKDETHLLSEAPFLGEFVVAPSYALDGRAGW